MTISLPNAAPDTRTIEQLRQLWCDAGFTIEDAGEFNRAAVKVVGGVAFYVSNLDGNDVAAPEERCMVVAFDPDMQKNAHLDFSEEFESLEAANQAITPELAAKILDGIATRFAAGELLDAQVNAIFDNAATDGWCAHDIDDSAMRAIFKRAASVSPATAELTDPQFKALCHHDREDGWCIHDFSYESLLSIFKRAAAFVGAGQLNVTSTSTAHAEHFLEAVRQAIEPEIFETGQCHTLAGVLQELFGGELFAIMRHQVTEEGDRFLTTYSHMVCEIEGLCFDVFGADADERWCAKWSDEPDEDGLTSEFEFIAVPPAELFTFIEQHRASAVDKDVLAKLQEVVEHTMPATPDPSKSFPSMR